MITMLAVPVTRTTADRAIPPTARASRLASISLQSSSQRREGFKPTASSGFLPSTCRFLTELPELSPVAAMLRGSTVT
ncbi:hypothetical protein F7725_013911 [Dissostichus mawsoni]|uniref:Uncharacterized protein n=1 Tax=Dissostichus mawsoni TaxID=36200 RepID=A0A7J5YVK9_DISMA|nr:hypothetical protein F7725_013911 [Dissostichus mawsoni]